MINLSSAFWSNVDIREPNECWNWKGSVTNSGYGQQKNSLATSNLAHRIAYISVKGVIPSGLDVCHTCDNKLCCNPAHLFLGTRRENMLDASKKGRLRGETHCTINYGASFSQDEIEDMISLRNEGKPFTFIGAKYHIDHKTAASIVRHPDYYYKRRKEIKDNT